MQPPRERNARIRRIQIIAYKYNNRPTKVANGKNVPEAIFVATRFLRVKIVPKRSNHRPTRQLTGSAHSATKLCRHIIFANVIPATLISLPSNCRKLCNGRTMQKAVVRATNRVL
jgi:hypothetical protein